MNRQILFYGSPATLTHLHHIPQLDVIVVDDLQEIDAVRHGILAIVIEMDDQTPEAAWFEALETIPTLAALPKIALTAPEYFERALAVGAKELCRQPLNLIEIDTRLNTIVDYQKASLIGALDVIAHDLNSPLGIIEYSLQLSLEILEDGADALPDIRQFIENMLTASYRLRLMMMDLLDYIRLANHQLQPTKTSVDVHRLILTSIQSTAAIGYENHIQIRYDAPESVIRLRTDANLLQRSIEAALDTALKFCQPRSTIEINVQQLDGRVLITIKDPGQPPDTTYLPEAVFMPYPQSTMRETGKRSAVGLSLPFIAAAIRTLGGDVALIVEESFTILRLSIPSTSS